MFEKYIPIQFLGEFCEFAGISELRESRYSGEAYRGFWKQSIVIFSPFREGWVEVDCSRDSLREEFAGILKQFHVILDEAMKDEKN